MTAYRFVMWQRGDGMDVATMDWNGQRFEATSRNGASMTLARQLIEVDAPDGPVEIVGRDDRLRWTAPGLHRLAGLTMREGDGRPHIAPFSARPDVLAGV